jgi:hypothetical protein
LELFGTEKGRICSELGERNLEAEAGDSHIFEKPERGNIGAKNAELPGDF